MKKQEAITAMQAGKKVTHRYMSDGEYMFIKNDNKYCFEDGVEMEAKEFWELRTLPGWEDDWSIHIEAAEMSEEEKLKHDVFFLRNRVEALKKENTTLEKAATRAQDHAESLLAEIIETKKRWTDETITNNSKIKGYQVLVDTAREQVKKENELAIAFMEWACRNKVEFGPLGSCHYDGKNYNSKELFGVYRKNLKPKP